MLAFMFHHVKPKEYSTDACVDLDIFEKQLQYIVSKKYQTIFASELVNSYENEKFRRNSIVLTFDDGYVDNYIYAYPLLKKYNLKATFFVSTAFISDKNKGNFNSAQMEHDGVNRLWVNEKKISDYYLDWIQIKEMVDSGIVDIQTHGHFHNRCFVSDEIEGANINGMAWSYPLCTKGDTRQGLPVFRSNSELSNRRFEVDSKILSMCNGIYRKYRGQSGKNIEKIITNKIEHLKTDKITIGSYENITRYKDRVYSELNKSIDIIFEKLKVRPVILSYPWGDYNKTLIDICRELGIKGGMTISKEIPNSYLYKSYCIKRIESPNSFNEFKLLIKKNTLPLSIIRDLKRVIKRLVNF